MQSALIDFEPNYESAKFPTPRPFQDSAHDKLREGARNGHRCQMLMSPTGSGKTLLGMRAIHESLLRGKKAIFLCDRTTLINQTSEVADSYGLTAHSIIQSGHWRYDLQEKFHIASVQTLARRSWPDADLIVIDESHTLYKSWTDHIPNCRAHVIGLSATPFSRGLGKLFTNLINAATMHELTESGVLVPMRVYSCARPDMRGAETSGGEWTAGSAAERGMELIGHVVQEWIKLAENRKTILFGPTIAYCEEMCRKFNEAGVMAAVFTSETTDSERKELLNEFRKNNSVLRVLLSVEALAKGFDCIAEGSEVLTHRGLVAIEKVLYNDKLWDGHEFVSHGGIIYKGERDVITYSGLTATEDHLVKTSTGWVPFGECARLGIPIVCTASGQRHIREDEGRFTNGNNQKNHKGCITEPKLPMRAVRIPDATAGEVVADRSRVQEMLYAKRSSIMDSCKGKQHEGALRKLIAQSVQRLRSAWNRIQVRVTATLCELDHVEYATAGQGQEYPTGSNRQQRTLRAGKSSMGKQEPELREYSAWWLGRKNSQISHGLSGDTVLGQDLAESNFDGDESGANSQQIPQAFGQAKRRVWDILNAGPRNSFTCEGLLVHNCADVGCVCDCRPLRKSLSTAIQMWGRGLRSSPDTGKQDCILLDFSGNIIRFADDFSDIYYNGLDQLDAGEKLDKTIRKDIDDDDNEPAKCHSCGFSPCGKRCIACGNEIKKKNIVEHLPGSLCEIKIGKHVVASDHLNLWQQICTYTKSHGKPETAIGRAFHLYKYITKKTPDRAWKFCDQPNVVITQGTHNQIKRNQIAYINAIKRGVR